MTVVHRVFQKKKLLPAMTYRFDLLLEAELMLLAPDPAEVGVGDRNEVVDEAVEAVAEAAAGGGGANVLFMIILSLTHNTPLSSRAGENE